MIDHDVNRVAGSGMVQGDFDGRLPQPLKHGVEPQPQAGESAPATVIRFAPIEQRAQRRLTRQRHVRAQGHVRRQHAVEGDPPCAAGEPAQVVLGDTGAVGDAIQVQFRVAERLANRVQVANGDAGREIAWIVGEACEAFAACVDHALHAARAQKQIILAAGAAQRCRPTSAALVDQDDVPIADNPRESHFRHRVEPRCGLPRPSRDHHQRVWQRLFGQRLNHRDEEFDGLAAGIVRVQRHREGPTGGVHFLPTARGGQVARRQVDPGGIRRRGEQAASRQARRGHGDSHSHGTELTRRRRDGRRDV